MNGPQPSRPQAKSESAAAPQPQMERRPSSAAEESEALARYLAAERERSAAREQAVESAVATYSTSFARWCELHAGATPAHLDPVERTLAFGLFRSSQHSLPTEAHSDALRRLEAMHASPQVSVSPEEQSTIKAQLRSAVRWSVGLIATLLRSTRVLESATSLPAAARAKYQEVVSFLRRSRTANPPVSMKAAVSVYQDDGRTFLQATRSDGKTVLLEIPVPITSAGVAQKLVAKLGDVIGTVTRDADPVAVIDGAMPALNFKELYPDQIVVRTVRDRTEGLEDRIKRLYLQPPLSLANTGILNAIPRDAGETRAVFAPQRGAAPPALAELAAMERVWKGVNQRWTDSASSNGFSVQQASRAGFLESVVQCRNVLVLVAHADSGRLWFPGPPPDGSVLTHEDVNRVSDLIRANGPTIYLYCCEAAAAEGLSNWATVLLEAGATAVVAPQRKLEAERTQRLFDKFLEYGTREMPLRALQRAERATRQRQLENWVG